MATYTYDRSYWPDHDTGNSLEWVITSGNGGYGGGSLTGGQNRTHQGYLIASLNPPTGRYVVLEQITEYVSLSGSEYDLESAQHSGHCITEGYHYLKRVTYDGTVRFIYELTPALSDRSLAGTEIEDGMPECESGTCPMSVVKHIALIRDENTVAVDYCLTNYSPDEAYVYLTPKFSFREHNTLTTAEDLRFHSILTGDTLSLVPLAKDDIRVDLSVSEGRFLELSDKFDRDRELQTEVDLETEGLNISYMPYDIEISVGPGESKHVSVICTVVCSENGSCGEKLLESATDRFVAAGTAARMIKSVREYYQHIEARAESASGMAATEDPGTGSDEFYERLVLDADHFVTSRSSTGLKTVLAGLPWFTDWGRDTMIAFTGLTLCTGRLEDAREILRSFARYERNGLIPNMFPDDGAEPLYNTADASLWYFIAVYDYLRYEKAATGGQGRLGPDGARQFILGEIYPVLIHILDAYEHGTDNSIYMEKSGLIHAGSGLDQVTWMDVRVGDMVVTPRHGCPVEINALWYNALRIGAMLAAESGDAERQSHWTELADRVEEVYEKVYYCRMHESDSVGGDDFMSEGDTGYLYDVVDGYTDVPAPGSTDPVTGMGDPFVYTDRDDSIRPNQIFAVSLPYTPLSLAVARQVVEAVGRDLYVGVGLRSLAPSHPDYHGEYRGALEKRDLSYHQGTAWGYLLGAYIDAYYRVHSGEPDIDDRMQALFEPVKIHQSEENCIGGICEVFEGDEPHTGRGCYTQAWSTGEILRAYYEWKNPTYRRCL